MARGRGGIPRSPWGLPVAIAAAALLLFGGVYLYRGRAGRPAETVREFMHIHGLAVDPHHPGRVWLATHAGLFRIEGGQWAPAGTVRPDLMGFTPSPAEPGVLYSSGHPGPGLDLPNPVGLIVSRDGGQSWQPVSLTGQADFHAMAVSPADPRLIVGWYGGELYRSEDRGATWKRSRPEALSGEGRAPIQLAAHPRDRNVLLAATAQGLLRSQDLGATWAPVLNGVVSAASYVLGHPDHLVAYQVGPGLVRSQDGGRTWQPLGFVAAGSDAVAYIAPHPEDARTIYIATFSASLHRTRDGATWQPLAERGKVVAAP